MERVFYDERGSSLFEGGRFITEGNLAQLRGQLGFQIARRFAVIGGPTLNVSFDQNGGEAPDLSRMPTRAWGSTRMWPGFQLGLRI